VLVFLVVVGASIGSFVGALGWRVRHDRGFVTGRSVCESCGRVLAVREIIPVASWMALGGRCRRCRAPISIRHPATELTGALIAGLLGAWLL
jgi:prepilin signal peptidase PulO-like enzyme (type II secretory pathway)